MKILIKFNDNYADEFDVDGFRVYTQEEWDEFKAFASSIPWPQAFYFGTNEGIEYTSAEALFKQYEVIEITDEQGDFLIAQFGSHGFGTLLGPDREEAEEYEEASNLW